MMGVYRIESEMFTGLNSCFHFLSRNAGPEMVQTRYPTAAGEFRFDIVVYPITNSHFVRSCVATIQMIYLGG